MNNIQEEDTTVAQIRTLIGREIIRIGTIINRGIPIRVIFRSIIGVFNVPVLRGIQVAVNFHAQLTVLENVTVERRREEACQTTRQVNEPEILAGLVHVLNGKVPRGVKIEAIGRFVFVIKVFVKKGNSQPLGPFVKGFMLLLFPEMKQNSVTKN